MSGDSAAVALESQKQEIASAIADIKANGAVAGCAAHGSIARGLIALLRCRAAEIDSSQADAVWMRTTRREIAKGIAARAMNIAWLIFAVGFLVLSINARSILDRIMPPRSTVQVQTERSKP